MKISRKTLNLALLIVVLISFFSSFWGRQGLFEKYDADHFEEKFNKSQWRDPWSEQKISDAELFIYAGTFYLQGGNPTLVNI